MHYHISNRQISIFRRKIIRFGKENYENFPWRTTDNLYHAITAEVMLQRTNATAVLPAYLDFISKYENPDQFLQSGNAKPFKSLGLAWRESEFRDLSQALATKAIGRDFESLLQLPGIGPYIAGAVCSLHLGIRAVIIDSNVVRLYGRYFGFETDPETRRKKWFISLADTLTPPKSFKSFNYGLLDHTRKICKPRPKCDVCPLKKDCDFFQNQV